MSYLEKENKFLGHLADARYYANRCSDRYFDKSSAQTPYKN